VFEQLPTPVTAEFRDIRAWRRWAALAGRHLYANFRIITERAPRRNLNYWERK
jgi:hypothetical protein